MSSGGEQAQSYFLERQNSHHQNLHSLGSTGRKKKKRSTANNHGSKIHAKNNTPVASNGMRKSSSGSTFATTSPSLSTSSGGLRKTEEHVVDEELGGSVNNIHPQTVDDETKQPLLHTSQSTSSLRSGGGKAYGSTTSNNSNSNSHSQGKIMRIPSALLRGSEMSSRSNQRTIRFQVVVWNIGKLDVVTGSVPMTFRVSLFWNDIAVDDDFEEEEDLLLMDDSSSIGSENANGNNNNNMPHGNSGNNIASSVRSVTSTNTNTAPTITWKMHGRSKAIPQDFGGFLIPPRNSQTVGSGNGNSGAGGLPIQPSPSGPSILEVPPLSILNVATFETIGGAEVDCLDASTKLFRWTAMYRATVLQQDVGVEDFPHDLHQVQLKLAILNQRSRGRQWDSRIWKLALATEEDSQFSTRIPHGLIVDQVKIPGFAYNKERGLQFDFVPLNHGSSNGNSNSGSPTNGTVRGSMPSMRTMNCQDGGDSFLRVSVTVLRESGYYDQNIVPLVALLNVVAVSVLTFQDSEFFYRALITLNIAFVEMSIRMTADSHLPSVGYQIKLQRILNEWFVILMLLVLEGMLVFVLSIYFGVDEKITKSMDWITAMLALGHNVWRVIGYYRSKKEARYRLEHGGDDERRMKKMR